MFSRTDSSPLSMYAVFIHRSVSVTVFFRTLLVRTVENFGVSFPHFRSKWMALKRAGSKNQFRGLKGVSDDEVSRKRKQILQKTERKQMRGFVSEYVRSPARHQSEMFTAKSWSVLKGAEPVGRTLCLRICRQQWQDGHFPSFFWNQSPS